MLGESLKFWNSNKITTKWFVSSSDTSEEEAETESVVDDTDDCLDGERLEEDNAALRLTHPEKELEELVSTTDRHCAIKEELLQNILK